MSAAGFAAFLERHGDDLTPGEREWLAAAIPIARVPLGADAFLAMRDLGRLDVTLGAHAMAGCVLILRGDDPATILRWVVEGNVAPLDAS